MKFTKRGAASVALGAALLLCVGYANGIGAEEASGPEIDGSSGATRRVVKDDSAVEMAQGDLGSEYAGRDAFEIIETSLHVAEKLLTTPGGEWALAYGYGERTGYPDLEDFEYVSDWEQKYLLLDQDMNIVREFGESSHNFWPRGHMTWAPDESAFVFIASPPRPPRVHTRVGPFESEHEPGSEELEKDMKEFSARKSALSDISSKHSRKRAEARRTKGLFRVDMDSYEMHKIAEIEAEGSVLGLETGPEGDLHLAMRGHHSDSEPWYKVHQIGYDGETKVTYELPLIPANASVRNVSFNAASTSFWFALQPGVGEAERLCVSTPPPPADAPVWLTRIAYGPGNEQADWEFWRQGRKLRLTNVAPCGKAVLFRVTPEDAESFTFMVLDVDTGHVTPVVSDEVTFPERAVAVLDGGAVVRFRIKPYRCIGLSPTILLDYYRLP